MSWERFTWEKSPFAEVQQGFKALHLKWALCYARYPSDLGIRPGGSCVQETSQAAWGESSRQQGSVDSASSRQNQQHPNHLCFHFSSLATRHQLL